MIAIISSTIKPVIKNEKAISFYSFEERLDQTKLTLVRLKEAGFDLIFLADNSPLLDQSELEKLLQDFKGVVIFHLRQYQFSNKGINELLMLLFLTGQLPPNEIIFKISARYYLSPEFKKPDFVDFAVKQYDFKRKTGTISTRGYWVKNTETLHRFLLSCFDELFAYPERIVGLKSLFRLLFVKKNVIDEPLNISIEFAAANVLKAGNYQVRLLDRIGIEGLVAGANNIEKITE
jgi:hypothetical protein